MILKYIKTSDMIINPLQRRELNPRIEELKNDIERHGLMNPILVREQENKYELLDGYFRVLVFKELKWEIIPAVVVDISDKEVNEYLLFKSSNTKLTSKELGRFVTSYMERTNITIEEFSKKIGKTIEEIESWIKAYKEEK